MLWRRISVFTPRFTRDHLLVGMTWASQNERLTVRHSCQELAGKSWLTCQTPFVYPPTILNTQCCLSKCLQKFSLIQLLDIYFGTFIHRLKQNEQKYFIHTTFSRFVAILKIFEVGVRKNDTLAVHSRCPGPLTKGSCDISSVEFVRGQMANVLIQWKKMFSRIGHTRKSWIHFEDLWGCRHKGVKVGTSRGLGCAVAAPGCAVFGRPRSIGHHARGRKRGVAAGYGPLANMWYAAT